MFHLRHLSRTCNKTRFCGDLSSVLGSNIESFIAEPSKNIKINHAEKTRPE